jgi:uncharacterized membrane protein
VFELLNEIFPPSISVFLMSMMPIVELRGAIPLGVGLGMPPIEAAIIAILGNSLVVPVLLMIVNPLFAHFKRLKAFRGFFTRYEDRAAKKISHYREYRLIGLFLLVAIPLPMTGAYTGCVAAVITKISFRRAAPTIIGGVITAGLIVYVLTYSFHTLWFV